MLNDYPEQFGSSFPRPLSFVSLFWISGQPFLLFKCPYVAVKEAIVTTMFSIWFCVTVTQKLVKLPQACLPPAVWEMGFQMQSLELFLPLFFLPKSMDTRCSLQEISFYTFSENCILVNVLVLP